MSWDRVQSRIDAKAKSENVTDEVKHISGKFYYSVLGQALCNKSGDGYPGTVGDKPSMKEIAEAYKSTQNDFGQDGFEHFMVAIGGHYPDATSLRVKLSNINKKLKSMYINGKGLSNDSITDAQTAQMDLFLLKGLRCENTLSALKSNQGVRSSRESAEAKELADWFGELI
jgi:hypothetical protein